MSTNSFNTVYKNFLNLIKEDTTKDITDRVSEFIHYDEYAPVFNKFKKRMNDELEKVRHKHPLLKNARFSFEGNDDIEDDGWIAMSVWPNDTNVILVNMQPFVTALNDDFSDESFENAIVDYYYNANTGEHVVQHECAHIIDLNSPPRVGRGTHDETFKKIQKDLDAIEPHLDEE